MSVHWGGRGPGHLSRWPKAAASPAWTPASLGSSLLAYWDGDASGALDLAGSNVTNWTDTKSGYILTQSLSGNKPAYSAAGLNGHGSVTGDGVDDRLALAPVPSGLLGVAMEIWLLVNQPALVADATARGLFYLGATSAFTRLGIFRAVDAGANRAHLVVGNGSTTVDSTVAVDFSGICVLRCEVGLTASRISVNGTAGSSNAVVPSLASTRLALLAQNTTSGSSFSAFDVNAAIITAPLSSDDATLMLAFLKARGGLT